MSVRARRIWLTVMLLAAIVGGGLVITASDDGPALVTVVTAEGLLTEVPDGWEPVDDRPFEFIPEGSGERLLDRWTVARACGPDGCAPHTLAEWLVIAEDLPTFAGALDDEGELWFDVSDEWRPNARILRAETAAGARQVFVAAFTDGADFYVACAAAQFDGDDRVEAMVDVCLETRPAD